MLLDAEWDFYRYAWIARRRVSHRENIDLRAARRCGRCNDDCARSVLATLFLARVKFPTPQERISKDQARFGRRAPHPNRREARSGDHVERKPVLR
jgi:hypothetical protein